MRFEILFHNGSPLQNQDLRHIPCLILIIKGLVREDFRAGQDPVFILPTSSISSDLNPVTDGFQA